ncbi:MAG: hypothetical protein ABI277_13605 [Burkholderiaceae bacterium]
MGRPVERDKRLSVRAGYAAKRPSGSADKAAFDAEVASVEAFLFGDEPMA